MMPSPSDLAYFAEVAASSNLTRAAERLGVSQPSLTLSMKRLEDNIGTPLLLRSKKGVSLTQAGKQLATHVKVLLQNWNTVKARAVASMNGIEGSYTLGCHPSVALYTLPFFLADILKTYPQLEIRLLHDLSRKIAESVIRLETDIGIVVNPIAHPDLIIKKLADDEVGFWQAPDHTAPSVLICDPELAQTRYLLKQLENTPLKNTRLLFSSSLEVITQLVSNGAGYGVLPGRVARLAKLKKVPHTPAYQDEICLVYRVENRAIPFIRLLIEAIGKTFAED